MMSRRVRHLLCAAAAAVALSASAGAQLLPALRLADLIRSNGGVREAEDRAEPVRRGVLVVANPDPLSLQLAERAGFRIVGNDAEPQLGLRLVELSVPRAMAACAAL